jgi:hypothetical protein
MSTALRPDPSGPAVIVRLARSSTPGDPSCPQEAPERPETAQLLASRYRGRLGPSARSGDPGGLPEYSAVARPNPRDHASMRICLENTRTICRISGPPTGEVEKASLPTPRKPVARKPVDSCARVIGEGRTDDHERGGRGARAGEGHDPLPDQAQADQVNHARQRPLDHRGRSGTLPPRLARAAWAPSFPFHERHRTRQFASLNMAPPLARGSMWSTVRSRSGWAGWPGAPGHRSPWRARWRVRITERKRRQASES